MRRIFKGYYYTINKTKDGYVWYIKNKKGELLESSSVFFKTKNECEFDCEDHINEYYY